MESTLLCHHFDENFFLSNAKKLLNRISSCKSKIKKDTVCLSCGYLGDLTSFDFQNHLLDHQHHFCMRAQEPHELYCSYCGDYQYSKSFDELIGRKRRFDMIENKISNGEQSIPLEKGSLSSTLSVFGLPDMKPLTIVTIGNKQSIQPVKKISFVTRGICNMGSTCFMGSVLQVLLHTELLHTAMTSNNNLIYNQNDQSFIDNNSNTTTNNSTIDYNQNVIFQCLKPEMETNEGIKVSHTKGCIPCELRQLFEEATCIPKLHDSINTSSSSSSSSSSPLKASTITSNSMYTNSTTVTTPTTALIPAYLLYSVWTYAEYMAGYEQQDAHEFLVALLDGLETHLHKFHVVKSPSYLPLLEESKVPPLLLQQQGSQQPESSQSGGLNESNNNSSSSCSGGGGSGDTIPSSSIGLESVPRVTDVDDNLSTTEANNSSNDNNNNNNNSSSSSSSSNSGSGSSSKNGDNAQIASIELVKEIFSGVMMSDLKCGYCGNRSCKYERFVDISLTLDLTRSHSMTPTSKGSSNSNIDSNSSSSSSKSRDGSNVILDNTNTTTIPVSDKSASSSSSSSSSLKAEGNSTDCPARSQDTTATTTTTTITTAAERSEGEGGRGLDSENAINLSSQSKIATTAITSTTATAVTGSTAAAVTDTTAASVTGAAKVVTKHHHHHQVELTSCLDEFTRQEQLSEPVTCEACNEMRPSSKQLSIASPPQILVIQLKRFNPITQLKMSTHVSFPLTSLDLTPYMSHSLGTLHSNSTTSATSASSSSDATSNDMDHHDNSGSMNNNSNNSNSAVIGNTCTTDYRLNTPNNNNTNTTNTNSTGGTSNSGSNTGRSEGGGGASGGECDHEALGSSRSRNSSVTNISSVPVSPRVYGSYAHRQQQQPHNHHHHHSYNQSQPFHSPHNVNTTQNHHQQQQQQQQFSLSPSSTNTSPSSLYLSSTLKNNNTYNSLHSLSATQPSRSSSSSSSLATANTAVEVEMEPVTEQVPIQSVSSADCLYDLYGVVCHSGTLSQGHYISYVLNASGAGGGSDSNSNDAERVSSQWLRCDDEAVTAVSEATVQSSEAYILFYRRRHVSNDEKITSST